MRIKPLLLLPWVIFIGLIGLAAGMMMQERSRNELPSTLIGQPAPRVPAEGLPGRTLLTDADLRAGEVTIVNFWASWCPPCRAEHPTLTDLAAQGHRLVGVNFRDRADNAGTYLAGAGDPFLAQGYDPSGRVSIDWGVTAPPETFILGADGTVLFRFVGPLIGSDYEQRFLPALAAAANAAP
ncbi:MAG: DsbE family thiol:disulfide interchange protein [Rubellimicrobium sp.]|nr:DsbE family thiol:disulfide interchange protein [Rubellimicrobium sp.]